MRSFAAVFCSVLFSAAPAALAGEPGVVVESLRPGGAASTAGLSPGDVLVTWSCAARPPAIPTPVSGSFRSPFDVREVEIDRAARGEVTVSGRRGEQSLRLVIPSGRWRMDVRPNLDTEMLGDYLEALAAIDSGDVGTGVSALENLAIEASENGDNVLATWLLTRTADSLEVSEDWTDRNRLLTAAVGRAQETEDPRIVAQMHEVVGEMLKAQGRFVDAEQAHRHALELREELAPDSLAVATSLNHLGSVVWRQGNLDRAQELWERCLTLRTRLAPGSIDEAASLNNLGILAFDRGDLAVADELYSRSLEIIERLDPDSVLVAMSLLNLVLIAHNRGDFVTAEERARRSVAINKRLEPDGFELAKSLNNLGLVSYARGDVAAAEEAWRRASAIFESRSPNSLELAATLNNLSVVALIRDDLEMAEDVQRRALAIRESIAPESLDTALSLDNLSQVVVVSGDFETAERLQRRALEMRQQLAPDSFDVALSLAHLSEMALEQGDLDDAEELGKQAFEIRSRLAPGSPLLAASEHLLGEVARQRGDLIRAEQLYRRALKTREVLTPGTHHEAETLHALGVVLRDRGRTESAAEMLHRAMIAVETQRVRRGGALERRGLVRGMELAVYYDLMQLLLDTGRPENAFAIFERSRAQGLLAILSERDLVFAADIPEDLDRERRMVAAAADRVLSDLGDMSAFAAPPEDAGQRGVGGLVPVDSTDPRAELLAELRRLRQRQEEIRTRIRTASPRLAALTAPEPLDLEGTRAALDPGTVLLAYAVGDQGCQLFVVERGRHGVDVYNLGVDSNELQSSVQSFRTLIQSPTGDVEEIKRLARQLGETLLAPAVPAISRARRLVIVPDGPLHLAPFAALRVGAGGGDRFLVELKPLSVVVSATVLAELKKSRRTDRKPQVVVFADPSYPVQGGTGTPLAVAAQQSGISLRPLPASRREAATLHRLYGTQTETWLGTEATEERAKRVDRGTTILHFAAHSLISERLPLESAIALTVGPPNAAAESSENGLLQAWEVLEQVRLDADLVTLSGCQTALGKEATGEGIIGLTRAFQYAGARTVLASLWSVADDSTAELMDRFYRRLRSGTATNDALRAAQLDLLTAPLSLAEDDGESRELDASHPFHWAAFQVIGDWR